MGQLFECHDRLLTRNMPPYPARQTSRRCGRSTFSTAARSSCLLLSGRFSPLFFGLDQPCRRRSMPSSTSRQPIFKSSPLAAVSRPGAGRPSRSRDKPTPDIIDETRRHSRSEQLTRRTMDRIVSEQQFQRSRIRPQSPTDARLARSSRRFRARRTSAPPSSLQQFLQPSPPRSLQSAG